MATITKDEAIQLTLDRLENFVFRLKDECNGIAIPESVTREAAQQEASEALANGDILRCLIFDTLDQHLGQLQEEEESCADLEEEEE